jgi:tyrosyl-tRNA synthetase
VRSVAEDFAFRGLIHQLTDQELLGRLDAGGMTVYAGFDPSAASLHHGNLLQLCTLRRLQLAGHRPIALAGGGTGFIGDPSGRSSERNLLDQDQLASNLEGIRTQLGRLLDFDRSAVSTRALLVDNAAWLSTLSLIDFLRGVGKHVTINQMLKRESVRSRLERDGEGISYTEFSYMLLQAYDFLRLHLDYGCDLQIGGSDQWGNIALGAEVVGKLTGDRVYGLTTPLITRPDGTKYGKSLDGAIWLDPARTSPYRFYQFFLNVDDRSVGRYLRFYTFFSHEEIAALDAETEAHPQRRTAQRALARAVCELVHGPEETERVERASAALFGGDLQALDEGTLLEVFEDAPSSVVPRTLVADGGPGSLDIVGALVCSGLCASLSEARRLVEMGGAYLNNVRVDDPSRAIGVADLLAGRYLVLRKGRRDYHLLRAE